MKKLTSLLLTAALLVSFAACGGKTEKPEEEAYAPFVPREETENPDGYYVEVCGVKLDFKEAASFTAWESGSESSRELTAEEAIQKYENGEDFSAEWEGFALIRQSTGEGYNTLDHPDFISEGDGIESMWDYNVDFPENTNPVVKLYDGDGFSGLTVNNARFGVSFWMVNYEDWETGGTRREWSCEYSSSFRLDGEITLTGFIASALGSEGYTTEGDITFYPAPEAAGKLPFLANIGTWLDPWLTFYDNVTLYSDARMFNLGTIYDEAHSGLDLDLIPNDGTANRVTVTLTGMGVRNSDQLGFSVFGTITKIS